MVFKIMLKALLKFGFLLSIILLLSNYAFAVQTSDVFGKQNSDSQSADLSLIKKLPAQDFKTFITSIIRLVLGFVGTLSFISLSISGGYYVLGAANSDLQNKAKDVLKYSLYGIIIIALSYSVVYGIANLDLD
jgi:hypothetical protein